jgi:hypothetical protein
VTDNNETPKLRQRQPSPLKAAIRDYESASLKVSRLEQKLAKLAEIRGELEAAKQAQAVARQRLEEVLS